MKAISYVKRPGLTGIWEKPEITGRRACGFLDIDGSRMKACREKWGKMVISPGYNTFRNRLRPQIGY